MNTTWDLVENKIKIENRFRIDVTDYINKMYKTRKNSILPYDINTEDVFEMLQDLTWTTDDKFVVFFNFEFVMCLMKLQISPDRITYIAPSKESFYVVRDGGWGERGMKSILFDLNTYKKYQTRKQWKLYLMKKLGKGNDFIVVGNIPFTINDNTEYEKRGRSKNIGDNFIKLISDLSKNGKYVYILRQNFESKSFKNNVLLDSNLNKIVYHSKSIFDIHDNIKTIHIVGDSSKKSSTFTYQSNTSSDIIELPKDTNVILSKNIKKSFIPTNTVITLGDIWMNGTRLIQDITNSGKYKMITTPGSYKTDDVNFTFDETENCTFGKWKVVLPYRGGGKALKIAGPEYSISRSTVALVVDSEQSALNLKEWILENDLLNDLNELRLSSTNSKSLFSKISLPDGII